MSDCASRNKIRVAPVRPLAGAIAALFAAVCSPAAATTVWTVDACDDGAAAGSSTTGNLRYALTNAGDGDVVDLTALSSPPLNCSAITLTTGALVVSQPSLTLIGPGSDLLVIDASSLGNADRVIEHTGTGTLYIDYLGLAGGVIGSVAGNATGGCVYSAGGVNLLDVDVHDCTATTLGSSSVAGGGGIYARGKLFMTGSRVHDNSASTVSTGKARGAGIMSADGPVEVEASTISGNHATNADTPANADGGGMYLGHGGKFFALTLSGNSAGHGGGLRAVGIGLNAGGTLVLANSNVSGNSAITGSAIYASNVTPTLDNTTIAFNTTSSTAVGDPRTAAVFVTLVPSATSFTLRSTLIADNVDGRVAADDFSFIPGAGGSSTITGGSNIVRASSAIAPPPGSNLGVCPLLGPLRDNGGGVFTHALQSGSPGIDQGSNPRPLTYDARGAGYLRGDVLTGITDIGAYEVQKEEIVFSTGFDGCAGDLVP